MTDRALFAMVAAATVGGSGGTGWTTQTRLDAGLVKVERYVAVSLQLAAAMAR